MSQGARWLEGFATAAALLGVRKSEELRSLLPEGTPLPAWWLLWERSVAREERARALAPSVTRVGRTIESVALS